MLSNTSGADFSEKMRPKLNHFEKSSQKQPKLKRKVIGIDTKPANMVC